MLVTDHQAKYLAYELTKRSPSGGVEKLAASVAGAQVDLNPHQVDAALFAFDSPLSRTAILADEVGLGKTIDAGANGINIQFRSLEMNYDLPWNPQCIGRCHRYGQIHDPMVLNFLSPENGADQWFFEIFLEKFQLFYSTQIPAPSSLCIAA